MYLRPDEVARVLEKVGFNVDVVTQKAYGYRRGENYVYVNSESRIGRTAQFPLYLAGERHEHYGIPHGFSSRVALERYLNGLFGEAS